MLKGKNILIIGARAGGYGESIARSAVKAGARVFGTTLNPADAREAAFFDEQGIELIDVPLKFDFEARGRVKDELARIEAWFPTHGVLKLDSVIHAVAGGFPRQPSVMKAVGEILKGNHTFQDLATAVKRNVYYVNAGSFAETIQGLRNVTDQGTQFVALTYRGELPYFIAPTKMALERDAVRLAREGKRTLIAAFPEAWTQSSQFFTGIEVAIIDHYLSDLHHKEPVVSDLVEPFSRMQESLRQVEGFAALLEAWPALVGDRWSRISGTFDSRALYAFVYDLFHRMRTEGSFPTLRRAVEIISEFAREASAIILVREFLAANRFEGGDVRQIHFRDLLEGAAIGTAKPREKEPKETCKPVAWQVFEKDDIRETLSMYGENFLFLDRVVMESGKLRGGFVGFGSYTVPTPEQNPILRDHLVGMPLFGGHLQMEAAAQLGTFMALKLFKGTKLIPILTGTEFPDLNTMAPPGEKLTIMAVLAVLEKRNLTVDVVIENRFARSKGVIRGMIINQRLVRKMVGSFSSEHQEE
jgi:3-hydroxymyristoyl/3-hydroxydecanoyl-(acyl carrier protein) dehydratase/NAD(P)-dependent dehydrogenase (short-subunit alcohol dehydrogenase family)